jgi:carbon storage regulator
MLVLSRQRNESIVIGDDIIITVIELRGDKVRLAFDAPRDIIIHRKEIYDAIQKEKEERKIT